MRGTSRSRGSTSSESSAEDQEEREHKLGAWIGNQRSRAATLTPERMDMLSAIGMRWA
ncbi:helicase associated domain-containing protein [Streptomyces sp. NPDC049813]|uniref:helicase associated domain-containing protein n=1 Tax=Streptomyces sp. NPDC049813 TaxID=3365597 RepID=UPI00379AD0EF